MSMATDWVTLHGSCHCGKLRVDFSTGLNLENVTPRACDCAFCRKHGAAYVSDPAGRLSVSSSQSAVHKYRQGSNAADFLICAYCGVLVAVTYEHNFRIYGAVNTGCLDGHNRLGSSSPASPQALNQDEKISRWLQLWVPDVQMVTSGA